LPVAAAPTLEAFPPPEGASLPDIAANPGMRPENLIIPAIDLYVPVVFANYRIIEFEGKTYKQWEAPWSYRPGWQLDSAGLGVTGNTVLYGHHNVAGKVFERVHELKPGQVILMKSGDTLFTYRVVLSMLLEERGQPVDVRLDNARWILPSYDERITLITCWPESGNTHRVVVVAVRDETEQPNQQSEMIPVTGEQTVASTMPTNTVAVSTSTPEEALLWAPPVESSPFDASADVDLDRNPGLEPTWIRIPIIDLGYPIVPIQEEERTVNGQSYIHWEGPHVVAAGWESDSAGLGVVGNTVLFGWQEVYGAPFANLHKLLTGQVVQLLAGEEVFNYRVVYTAILEERCQDMQLGSTNARWVLPATDERVTLITCYPQNGYSHRVVVVALREK
jgi:LPXTG-site transpeptidase (sortase) family protein